MKEHGRYVLPSAIREVTRLATQKYTNGTPMYGLRVVSLGGAAKDLYTDDPELAEAWATDLGRSTPTARLRWAKLAIALPGTPGGRLRASASTDLLLTDVCELDWSGMLGSGLFALVMRGQLIGSCEPVAVKVR